MRKGCGAAIRWAEKLVNRDLVHTAQRHQSSPSALIITMTCAPALPRSSGACAHLAMGRRSACSLSSWIAASRSFAFCVICIGGSACSPSSWIAASTATTSLPRSSAAPAVHLIIWLKGDVAETEDGAGVSGGFCLEKAATAPRTCACIRFPTTIGSGPVIRRCARSWSGHPPRRQDGLGRVTRWGNLFEDIARQSYRLAPVAHRSLTPSPPPRHHRSKSLRRAAASFNRRCARRHRGCEKRDAESAHSQRGMHGRPGNFGTDTWAE
jgi:hypothetical protein